MLIHSDGHDSLLYCSLHPSKYFKLSKIEKKKKIELQRVVEECRFNVVPKTTFSNLQVQLRISQGCKTSS